MKGIVSIPLSLLLSIGMIQAAFGQPAVGRVEILETGGQVVVPEGMTMIPGLPLIVTEKDMQQIETARRQLETLGYVERPNDRPIAEGALRFMRSSVDQSSQWGPNVFRAADFDFSTLSVGRLLPEIAGRAEEAYVMINPTEIVRAYSGTEYGDIYINEMIGSSLGVIDDSGSPNIEVAGYSGYRTTVRYEGGQVATLVLFPTALGVTLVEIGRSFSEFDSSLEAFLTILATELQR